MTTPEQLVERARALVPTLRERASKTDQLRRLPDETIKDLIDAGFFKILQPARYGGYEMDPQALFNVQMTLAEGCASTAWVYGVVAVHSWQLALFDDKAQQEVWGENQDVIISSSYAPTGKVEKVEGGYNFSGRWSFSSGCDHCDWVFLGGFVPTEKGAPPDMRTFLLPKSDYVIEDNWHVAGLKGTGSKDIVVDNVFVPEHRTHKLIDGYKQNSPGNAVNTAPLFKLPFGQVFVRSVSTTAIGITQHALEAFRERAANRIAASDMTKVALEPRTQRVCSQAATTIRECKAVLHHNFDDMMAKVRAGESIPVEDRIQYRYESSMTVVKCAAAVDELFTASGGRAIFEGNALLRCFLDIHAARAHYANNPDKPGRNLGGVHVGLKNTDFFI